MAHDANKGHIRKRRCSASESTHAEITCGDGQTEGWQTEAGLAICSEDSLLVEISTSSEGSVSMSDDEEAEQGSLLFTIAIHYIDYH